MSKSWLHPERQAGKPREQGLTVLIDPGSSTRQFVDVVESHGELVDFVKLGWGTALVTKDLRAKVECLRGNGVGFFLGGTLFERAVRDGRLDELLSLHRELGAEYIEVSNGSIDLPSEAKQAHIATLSKELIVFSEVGYKDPMRSLELHPARWVEMIRGDLAAGAKQVILEARESGTSGICRADGEVRFGLIEEILDELDPKDLIFEAPLKALQVYFINKLGPSVNLANVSFNDVVSVETLRNGLRADTLDLVPGDGP